MNKFLVRFFLPLSILILSGFSQLNAHAFVNNSSTDFLEIFEQAALHTSEVGSVRIFKSATSNGPREIFFKIDSAEAREEETDSKKNVESGSYVTTFSQVHTLGNLIGCNKKLILSRKDFLCATSQRFLILQVFRI